ncbi:class I SAM-dependent methyltransferase [Pseudonocardia ailaonensis]|uniref:Class I SAM-dependent methyltransferase n=1 Tax=Pseudonocardia ailaonensis TaxID=367279 RepID=A0ABN2NQT4_9PSEU
MIEPGANAAQRQEWDGETGDYWVANADRYDACVAAYQPHLLAGAQIGPGEHVLDVGCGTGRTTRDVARHAATATGVDLSRRMIRLARERAARESVVNAMFLQADAQTHTFAPGSVDVIVSRHGVMFFDDPVAAFANLATALRPDGRLALLVWQAYEQQEWMRTFRAVLAPGREVDPTQPGAFSLGDPARVRAVLGAAGLRDVELDAVAEPMWFGPDPDTAATFIAGQFAGMLAALDDPATATAALREDMEAHHGPDGVRYDSAAWVVRARR